MYRTIVIHKTYQGVNKMKSVIRDIFHGFKGNMETMQLPKAHFDISGKKLSNAYDELVAKLSPELLKLHQNFADALEDNYCEEIDFYFVEGFKLGILMGIECLQD